MSSNRKQHFKICIFMLSFLYFMEMRMKSIEFMYWLQGSFELADVTQLSTEQTETVKRHLQMVKVTEGREMLPFCHWFEGFMEAVNWQLSAENTLKLKNKLNSCFEHVVPQTIEPQQPSGFHSAETSHLVKC